MELVLFQANLKMLKNEISENQQENTCLENPDFEIFFNLSLN